MIDRLLGRASLKERVEELEATVEDVRSERERLRRQLDSAEDQRADAVSDRQRAQERVNRLEDKITQLEDTVERLREGDSEQSFRGVDDLRGRRLDAVLDRLESFEADAEGVFTAMVEGRPSAETREAFGDRATLVERAAPCLAITDDEGLLSVALRPPIAPDPFETWGERVDLDRAWFRPSGRYAVALVRADLFALGEYAGEDRLSVTGFETDVKSDHSKGGFSQARFERRRDEQIQRHLDRCRTAIEDRSTDRLFLVGGGDAVDRLATDVHADATDTVGATGEPESALDDAVREFFTARLYRF